MLILICGSREWYSHTAIKRELVKYDPTTDVIIHGCARGADTIAGQCASEYRFKVLRYPANWAKFGKAAGPLRNQLMLDQNPDLVLAFHEDIANSKGTGDMVRRAKLKGVRVEVFDK